MVEVWKDVVGFEEYFMVSNFGNVLSKRTNKNLALSTSKTGYKVLSSKIGGRQGQCICLKVHRLVADAFLEKPSDVLIEECSKTHYKIVPVNHKDGNKLNNCVSNLEWVSYKENIRHAIDNGLLRAKKGLESKLFKLSLEQVLYIKENLIKGHRDFGARALARELNSNHTKVMEAYRLEI